MLGNFLKIDYSHLLFKTFKFCLFLMGNDGLSSKQVGSQASRRVTRWLAWIQPVCISINAVPALEGLNQKHPYPKMVCEYIIRKQCQTKSEGSYIIRNSPSEIL